MDYKYDRTKPREERNFFEIFPGVCVFFNCISDYKNFKIEADFEYTFFEDQSVKIKSIFDDQNSVIKCSSKDDWHTYCLYDSDIHIKGTITVIELYSISLECNFPEELYETEDTKDFTIVAEGQEIKVHKAILQQVSPVFSAMFESKWKESVEGKIEIPFLAFKLAKLSIELFYGKKYWRFLEKIEYIQLYQFADQYDITPLKNAVKNSIILTPLNIVEYANLVTKNKCEELIEHCINYFLICIQYSLQIPNKDILLADTKNVVFEKLLNGDFLKRNLEKENIQRDY